MASPEEVITSLPETLPEDFGEWDGEGAPTDLPAYSWEKEVPPAAPHVYSWETQAPPAAQSANTNEWDTWEADQSSATAPKSSGQSAERKAISSPATDKPQVSDSASYDCEAPSTAKAADSDEWAIWAAAHSSSKTPRPFGQSTKRKAILAPVTDEPPVSDSASSARVSVEQQKALTARDGEAPSAAKNVDSDEWAIWAAGHSIDRAPKPIGQSTERKATLSSVADKAQVSAPPAALVKPQESISELVDGSPSRASRRLETGHTTHVVPVAPNRPNFAMADEALFQMFSSVKFEVKGERKASAKKWMIVAAVSVCSILLLLLLMIPLLHRGAKSAAKQSIQPLQVSYDTQLQADNKAKPRASEPLTQDKTPATSATQPSTDNQPSSEADEANATQTPTETQTQMMNDQLSAPTRIPQGIQKEVAENEPAATSFASAGADGLGGNSANVNIFNGHAQPVVKAAPSKPVAISSGVAVGMLIQKTEPTYPLIAKTARVSGTVELAATISKIGTIKDLRVVGGPPMLRQAAADAVRTWRYRPYKLNNEPTEVETTINVVFSLGG